MMAVQPESNDSAHIGRQPMHSRDLNVYIPPASPRGSCAMSCRTQAHGGDEAGLVFHAVRVRVYKPR